MDEKLFSSCEKLLQYRKAIIGKMFWAVAANEEAILVSFLHISAGKDVDAARFKACKKILKKSAGILNEFRGYAENMVIAKMMLAEDPEEFVKGALAVYKQLRQRHKFTASPYMVMAAITIYEKGGVENAERYLDDLDSLYDILKKQHPWLISDQDRGYLSMLVTSGVTGDAAAYGIEECYQACKNISLNKDAVHSLAQVLALSSRPAQQKAEQIRAMIAKMKEYKHPVSKSDGLAALATLTLLDMPVDDLLGKVCEADDYLKGKKGFILCGSRMRRLYATLLVFMTYSDEKNTLLTSSISGTLTMQIVEQVIMMLVAASAAASTAASGSN